MHSKLVLFLVAVLLCFCEAAVFSTGSNTNGQLGINSAGGPITIATSLYTDGALRNKLVGGVFRTFGRYSIAIDNLGQLYAWGSAEPFNLTASAPALIETPGRRPIVSAAGGDSHAIILNSEGVVFTVGSNSAGQLGSLVSAVWRTPAFPVLAGPFVAVAAGVNHSAAVTSAGHLFVWGDNSYGQLGDGTLDNRVSPFNVSSIINDPIAAVACGAWHTLALTNAGDIWAFGRDSEGQIGNGSSLMTNPNPVRVVLPTSASGVSAGWKHSVAFSKLFVYAAGDNSFYQLGNETTPASSSSWVMTQTCPGNSNNVTTAVACGDRTFIVHEDGEICAVGQCVDGMCGVDISTSTSILPPQPILTDNMGSHTDLSSIGCGLTHSFFMNTPGPWLREGRKLILNGTRDMIILGSFFLPSVEVQIVDPIALNCTITSLNASAIACTLNSTLSNGTVVYATVSRGLDSWGPTRVAQVLAIGAPNLVSSNARIASNATSIVIRGDNFPPDPVDIETQFFSFEYQAPVFNGQCSSIEVINATAMECFLKGIVFDPTSLWLSISTPAGKVGPVRIGMVESVLTIPPITPKSPVAAPSVASSLSMSAMWILAASSLVIRFVLRQWM